MNRDGRAGSGSVPGTDTSRPATQNGSGTPPAGLGAAPPLVATRHLTRVYEGGVRALQDVNLTIRAGETVAIMGPSGSGKSTLLHLLGALDLPTSGQVLIAGQDLATVRDLDGLRASTVGFVFQFHNLIPTLTALENVLVPMCGGLRLASRQRARAMDLLAQVGLAPLAGRRPAQLSGGQRQRVALARALANSPALILADEPTGNLDSKSGAEVLHLLGELNAQRGTTIVLVTHDPVVALGTRRLLLLRDGRIEQDQQVEAVYLEEMTALQRTRLGRLLFGE